MAVIVTVIFLKIHSSIVSSYKVKLINHRNLYLEQPPQSHNFVGDKGFKLETFLMHLFPRAVVAQDKAKIVFNKQLSRTRRVVKNAFGI